MRYNTCKDEIYTSRNKPTTNTYSYHLRSFVDCCGRLVQTNRFLVGAARCMIPLLSKGIVDVQEGTEHTFPLHHSLCRIKGSQAAAQALQLVCWWTFSSTELEFNAATCRLMTFACVLNSSEVWRRLKLGTQISCEYLVMKLASSIWCFKIFPKMGPGSSKYGTLNLRKVFLCSCPLAQLLQKTWFSWAGHV